MSINDEWVRYLRASGYTGNINQMMIADLQEQTGSSSRHPNSLWVEYLVGEGYSGSLPDMMYQWLGDKGYTGNINDRMIAALRADDVFSAPSCSISLTGDTAVGAGYNPMNISGQTASYTLESPANVWLANQPAQRSKPATGTILVEVKISGTGGGAPSATISDATFTNRVLVGRDRTSGDIVIAVVEAGSPTFSDTLSPTSKYAFGVNSAGDVLIYVDGVSVDLGGAGAGMFSATNFALAAIDLDMQTSGTGSVQFITAGANFESQYVGAGLLDWCDTDTVPAFDPLTLSGLVAAFDRSRLDTMYLTSNKDTNITVATDPVGLALDLSEGAVSGPEKSPNAGDPFTVTTGISYVNTTPSISSGKLVLTATAASFSAGNWSITGMTVGAFYEITVRARNVTSSTGRVWNSEGFSGSALKNLTGTMVTYRYFVQATAATGTVAVYANLSGGAIGDSVEVESVSVKEVLGNHATQSTAPARPFYQIDPQRLAFDELDDAHVISFSTAPGSDCTVCRADPSTGASILTAQTIGTSYSITASDAGLYIYNRALTAGETASMEAFLDALAGV